MAPRVANTQELGALLYEGEMLSNEAMALLDTTEVDSDYQKSLLAVFGQKHLEDHRGVFTDRGYVEPGNDFKEIYQKGEMFCFLRSSSPVVLEVSKGFFDDPQYDNDKTAILNLPAVDANIWRAVEEVDAASVDECAFRCIDCEIPSLRDAVDDAIEQEGGIGMANEFAKALAQKERAWHEEDWVKCKALLSVAGHPSLQDAIQLMHGLDMMMNILAAGMELTDEDLRELRGRCVREVKETRGRISFEDAWEYQKGSRETPMILAPPDFQVPLHSGRLEKSCRPSEQLCPIHGDSGGRSADRR